MSLAQQNKIKRSSKTIITHHFVILHAECLLTFGPEYFVFQNNMSDMVHQSMWKNYFDRSLNK
jgi:hypothetical protein